MPEIVTSASRLKRLGLRATRLASVIAVLCALALLAIYFWLPGAVAARQAQVEQFLAARLGLVVQVAQVGPHWEGLHPGVRLIDARVLAADRQTVALTLPEARASIAWLPLLWGEVRLHRLEALGLDIGLTRLADGRFQVAGFPPFMKQPGGDGAALRWLFRQHELIVSNARVTWTDRRQNEAPRVVDGVQLALRNAGARHHFLLSAAWPETLCAECSINIDLIGDPLKPEETGGQARAKLLGFNAQALPAIIGERMPATLRAARGTIDAQAWAQWQQGLPVVASGRVAGRGLYLPANDVSEKIDVPEARADFQWRRGPEGWDLSLGDARIGEPRKPWLQGAVYVARDAHGSTVEIERFDAAAATRLLTGLRRDSKGVLLLRALKPEGRIGHFKLRVTGEPSAPTGFSWQADVEDGTMAANGYIPGFRGATGHIKMTRDSGDVLIRKMSGDLDFPRVFAVPIPIENAAGRVTWRRTDEHWQLQGKDLRARNDEGRASAEFDLRLPFDKSRSPWMRLDGEVKDYHGVDALRFYPVRVLPNSLHQWLGRFVQAGRVEDVKVTLEGDLRRFPFKEGDGKFEVHGSARDARLEFLPGWAPIEKANARFAFVGPGMNVSGSGQIADQQVHQVAVTIPDLRAPDGAILGIDGNLSGPVGDALSVLRSGLRGHSGFRLPTELTGTGAGHLDLRLTIPLRSPKTFHMGADYRLDDAALTWGSSLLAEHMNGLMQFSETGIRGGQVRMRSFGGDGEIQVNAQTPGRVRLAGSGQASARGLERVFGSALTSHLEGHAAWRGSVDLPQGDAMRLMFEADLGDFALNVPPPLDKQAGEPLRLTVKSETADSDRHVLVARLGERAAARLAFARRDTGWYFTAARVHAGVGEPVLGDSGIHISARWPELKGDAWLEFMKAALGDGQPSSAWTDTHAKLTRVSFDFDALELFARPFGSVKADISRTVSGWGGTVDGASAKGNVFLIRSGSDRIVQLNLDRLTIPRREGKKAAAATPKPPPTNLPIISVQCKSFQFGDYALGRLALWGAPAPTGWKISHVVLSRPEMNVFFHGDWIMAPEQQKTDLKVELNTDNIGESLAAFGIRDQIQRGTATLKAQASWEGGPLDFDLNKADAKLAITAEKGQFLKVKQGAGKLLGIFDVNSLARYLTLDFSTLFGKGYSFDSIAGDMTLRAGDARTNALKVRGPSADLNIAGRVGVAAEDFDLEVAVTPNLGGSMAVVGGLYGGPIGLGTALLLERIWKKQIQKGTRVIYTVQGSWADPSVRRVIKDNGKSETVLGAE